MISREPVPYTQLFKDKAEIFGFVFPEERSGSTYDSRPPHNVVYFNELRGDIRPAEEAAFVEELCGGYDFLEIEELSPEYSSYNHHEKGGTIKFYSGSLHGEDFVGAAVINDNTLHELDESWVDRIDEAVEAASEARRSRRKFEAFSNFHSRRIV